ncbi:phage shock protein C (PspC) family protein [Amphibacillus marinus]|uniref:Phage shock protein C (PspC) family protein n=1 Tax=Amphibacillus marinus TaxID=872970 RepID=A0A1H8LE67_9BACI|nr:PspC domain-containing protein [Amphibacillus marinus]SEO03472.1 phage shock protein C (PspC) family protein [Amphibacillus marinus]
MRRGPLRKSSTDRVLSGVCGGIAEYLDIPAIAVRLIFFFGPPLLTVYIILAIFLPEE